MNDMANVLPETLRGLAVPLASLRPYPNNPRQGDIGAITESLRAHNQYRPVVVRRQDNTVLAGNHTLAAAKALGWAEIAATFVDVDDDEAARIVLVDNRTADLATNNPGQLAALLQELQATPTQLTGTGYDGDALDELLADLGQMRPQLAGDPDAVPQVPDEPISRPGDLWLLGEHRVLCGDCTQTSHLERLMAGRLAALVWTDPPYGVDYQGGRNSQTNTPRARLAGDTSASLYAGCLAATCSYCRHDAPWYLWFAGALGKPVYDAVAAAGYAVRAMIVWNKLEAHYGTFMAQYMQKHEPCLYCVKEAPPWYGPTNEVTVWDVKQPTVNAFHSTQKPVELAVRAIQNSSAPGAIVADWFLGSGTALIAAEQTGRICYGVDIEPAYCDVIVQRWQDLTGKTAVREQVDHDARVLTSPARL